MGSTPVYTTATGRPPPFSVCVLFISVFFSGGSESGLYVCDACTVQQSRHKPLKADRVGACYMT